jgi:predicted transcriptional regulator of viral defense system
LALSKILSHYSLITYGDDADTVKSSFNELLITKNINFQDPKDDDWAYSYLETVNSNLVKKGLVALVTKGYYNIIVCKIEKKEKITELFKKIDWEFIQP